MRRQPLHESRGGSVMTRRPRREAQISRCYHHLLPLSSPPPPQPPPPPSVDYHHQLLHQSPEDNDSCIITTSRTHPGPLHQSTRVFRAAPKHRVVTGTTSDFHVFKTSIFGRPFELSNVLTQVGKLPVWNLLLVFLVLSLLTPQAMCKPWMEEQPDKVTFRSRICQPVSQTDLRRQMGPAFDDAKMAADMSSAKNLFGEDAPPWNKGMDGYQSDGPAPGGDLQTDSSSLVESERFLSSGEMYLREEGMMYRGNGRVEEREEVDFDFDAGDGRIEEMEDIEVDVEDGDLDIEKKEVFGRRSWLPRRRIINSHTKEGADRGMSSVYSDFESGEKDGLGREKHDIVSDSFKYMRRRRRRRSLETGGSSGKFRSQFEETDRKSKRLYSKKSSRKGSSGSSRESSKKYKSLLPLRLSLSGKLRNSRKLRKQLKKEFRQQSRKLNKPPPWECKLRDKIVFLKQNIFPRILIDGRCETDKCFYRLYNCEPNKYAIKLLQRDENHCNPLPTLGNSTVFEERWNIITKHITVGCSCASLASNGRSKNRRKI